jgi:hypothetical protein
MIPDTKSSENLYGITTGENRVGVSRGEGEREREQQISRVRDRAVVRDRNGMC